MTIRLRYYSAIVPLFAGFALANVLLLWGLERVEITWGIDEQAKGAAFTVAGFLGEMTPDGQPHADPAAFQRYRHTLNGFAASWFEPGAGRWNSVPLTDSDGMLPPAAPDARIIATVSEHKAASRMVFRPDSDHDEAVGYAGVFAPDGKLRAIAAVVIRDKALRDEIATLVRQEVGFGAGVLVLGWVVAEVLAQLARRETRRLAAAARSMVHGDYTVEIADGRISELNDLAGTLRTMASSLADGAARTRMRFVQAKLRSRPGEMHDAFDRLCEPHAGTPSASRFVVRRLGRRNPADFFGVREHAGWSIAVAGRLESVPEGIEAALRTSAIREFLLGVGASLTMGGPIPDAPLPWPCACAEVVVLDAKGGARRFAAAATGPLEEIDAACGTAGTLSEPARRFVTEHLLEAPTRDIGELIVQASKFLANESGILVAWRGAKHSVV